MYLGDLARPNMDHSTINLEEILQNLPESPSFEPNPQTPATDSTSLSDQSSFENYMINDSRTSPRLPQPNRNNSFSHSSHQQNNQDFGDSQAQWNFDSRHIKLVINDELHLVIDICWLVAENQQKNQLQPQGLSLQQDDWQYQRFFQQQQDQIENLDNIETPQHQSIVENNVASNNRSQGMRQDSSGKKASHKDDSAYLYIEPPPQELKIKDKSRIFQAIQSSLQDNIPFVFKSQEDQQLSWEQLLSDLSMQREQDKQDIN